jgi:hypothetical protein
VERELAIVTLKSHLRCLDERKDFTNGAVLLFENSSVCCRSPFYSCRSSRCGLIDFVSEEHRSDIAPCRHIQLNAQGETLRSLFNNARVRQTETALREWLTSTIAKLESESAVEISTAA